MGKPEFVVAVLSLSFSLAAILLSFMALSRANIIARAELFNTLRMRYLEIHRRIPTEINDKNWIVEQGSDAWITFEQYWYTAFDEWFITTRIFTTDRKLLWRHFYRDAHQSALEHKEMKKVLLSMLDGNISFGNLRKDFENEVERMYLEKHPNLSSWRQSP